MVGHVYVLLEPDSDEVRYVGQTKQSLAERLRKHIYDVHRRKGRITRAYAWIRSLESQGKVPKIVGLATVPLEELDAAEIWWIAHLRESGANLTNHADGGRGGDSGRRRGSGLVASCVFCRQVRYSLRRIEAKCGCQRGIQPSEVSCVACHIAFKSVAAYKRHEAKAHSEYKLLRYSRASTKKNLLTSTKLSCVPCKKMFRSLKSFREHEHLKHQDLIKLRITRRGELFAEISQVDLECPLCGAYYRGRTGLGAHLKHKHQTSLKDLGLKYVHSSRSLVHLYQHNVDVSDERTSRCLLQ